MIQLTTNTTTVLIRIYRTLLKCHLGDQKMVKCWQFHMVQPSKNSLLLATLS